MIVLCYFNYFLKSIFVIMKYYYLSILYLVLLTACADAIEQHFIRKQHFDEGWSFFYTDMDTDDVFSQGTSGWNAVSLPHDWSIEMPFKKGKNGIPVGHTQGGTGWYKKVFSISPELAGKQLQLYFEGIYMNAEVWINGTLIASQPYGYTSFFCNITDYCKPGQPYVLAVKVRNEGQNSRWYAGSGIYRHVWLIATDKIHLDEWGVFITTEKSGEEANVNLSIDIHNKYNDKKAVNLSTTIIDQSGNIIGHEKSSLDVKATNSETIKQSIKVVNPDLWSVDFPNLYTAKIALESTEGRKDRLEIPFGIRFISFSAKDGFLLNGKPLELKGGCIHHDNGLLGAVALDRAEERKVELLKRNGFNAVRCAHNPPSEKFLAACDRLGLLVIAEAFDQWQKPKNANDYHLFFDQWHERDLTAMVLRDRNHPSVIMWSIGNEIKERADKSGIELAQQLKRIVKKNDSTRPVTAAINDYWDNPGLTWKDAPAAFTHLDAGGYNYMWWNYENDTKEHPERIIYGSETTAMERAANDDLAEEHPNIIGDFIWTAIDYLGESGIGHAQYVKEGEKDPPMFLDWPWFNAWCGDIDICGNKKPQAALRDILWNESKIEMLVHRPVPEGCREKVSYWGWPDEEASWNWKGHENELIAVKVYTRYPSVRLYLNNEIIAEKETEKKDRINKYSAHFNVKFQPGELKAVAVENGNEKESFILRTTGDPVAVRLIADRTNINNNPNDLSYIQIELIDKAGNVVPDRDTEIALEASGAGKIVAAGNADPTDMKSFRSMSPKTFKGKAMAILQPSGNKGEIKLTAKNSAYREGTISIKVN
jgi:hypothetical protein